MRTKHSPFIDARQNSRCDGPSAPPTPSIAGNMAGKTQQTPRLRTSAGGSSLYPSVPGDFYGPAWHDGASNDDGRRYAVPSLTGKGVSRSLMLIKPGLTSRG